MLESLLQPLSSLKRVGPKTLEHLTGLVGQNRIFDLLLLKPIRVEKIAFCPRLFEVQNNQLIIVKAKVESHTQPENSRQPYKVLCYTPTGYLNLVFFRTFPGQMSKLPVGREIVILGHLQKSLKINSSNENQITHPQEIISAEEIDKLPKTNLIYPLSFSITQKFLNLKIKESLLLLKKIEERSDYEWINKSLIQEKKWPSFSEALFNLHNPKVDLGKEAPYVNLAHSELDNNFSQEKCKSWEIARKRLAYDELLAWQIALILAKKLEDNNESLKKIPQETSYNLAEEFLSSLPFQPTLAQRKVMNEIKTDISSSKKMLRLLQGDVGSGKTIPAIFACLLALCQKKQSCVIVPITILAKQHFAYFKKLLENFNVIIEIITGATTKKQKEKILQNLADGKIDIIIGTHALIEDNVKFKNLGLAIIDEQHRFGVMQRLKLVEKGEQTDTLLMSATPIPRSLMMGLYGDMDISILDEKPKNRQEIETLIISKKKIETIYDSVKRATEKGDKIYWICPAVEESEEEAGEENVKKDLGDLSSAKEKHAKLAQIFGSESVSLIHGKMKEKEKEKIMQDFIKPDGSSKILVATTVIEVGIDVADAAVIIIENAEHFGLSQLHQLRGRVGRGERKSYCILAYGIKYGVNGRKRLGILRDSNDGFFIAEEDLKMRGSGEILGTKQSGFPEFRIANLNFDTDLLNIAHKNAAIILDKDQNLKEAENQKYRDLLQLFNYDECLKMVSGG